jgi:ligand-binding SRPBCC domain-containing protein
MADRGVQLMAVFNKKAIKHVLGELPYTAELYWQIRHEGQPLNKSFSLSRTEKWLPYWREAAESASQLHPQGKQVVIFATLRYWIEHAVLIGYALAGLGHRVTLAYLPYANWSKEINRFDLRRQNAYSRKILNSTGALLKCVSWLDVNDSKDLTPLLDEAIEEISTRDVQYTLQVEDIDRDSELYKLRSARNSAAAEKAFSWLTRTRPDVLLTPNGSILEMGAVYQIAQYLGIPAVTYEFGEQRGKIWLAQNSEVMHQDTAKLWETTNSEPLTEIEWDKIRDLYTSRQQADLWENFSRRWQGQPSQGPSKVRTQLGLDAPGAAGQPIVLLAANVIGDSLTLGRQIFTNSMTEWLQRTVRYFAIRPDRQLIIRIHPGERYTKGPSVSNVLQQALPELPAHIHLVSAEDPINTYDLIRIADLGLVYTTTVGLEMAMSGVPALVIGHTHYRYRGFTLDPVSWEDYFDHLEHVLSNPAETRLTEIQVEQAWKYAYRFFFEYPQPFPWHLLYFWDELDEWPLSKALSEKGLAQFGDTFSYLAGEPVDWKSR